MCGGRSNILHYVALIETNNMFATTPNGQSPSASLNKSNTPSLDACVKNELLMVRFKWDKITMMFTNQCWKTASNQTHTNKQNWEQNHAYTKFSTQIIKVV